MRYSESLGFEGGINMNVREFQANRAGFSSDELREYAGQWIAFSPDGRRVIAAHADLLQLDALIRAAGADPEQTPLEAHRVRRRFVPWGGELLMLQFPYQSEPLIGPPPPSLPASALIRWRPLIPVTLIGPGGKRRPFTRALLDTGSDDTIFPMAAAACWT